MMVGKCRSQKKGIISLILVSPWILFSSIFLSAEKLLIDEIVEGAVPSVVRIDIYDKTGELFTQGMGFFISPGKILTCEHVMEYAYSAQVISSIRNYNQAKILKIDENMDLALLMIDDSGEKSLQLENERVPIRDQYLIAIGYNYEKSKSASSYGIVHAVVSDEGNRDIFNSASIFSGWSGGPLLNLEGHVIGVHKLGWGDGPNVAISTGIGTIKKFLNRPDNPKDLAYAGSIEPRTIWSVILAALGKFFGGILEWIVYYVSGIVDFLFFHGVSRGIYILILTGLLIIWRSSFLFRSVRVWKRRNTLDKIIKWSNGISSLEMVPVLEKSGSTENKHILVDRGWNRIIF